MKRYLPIIAFLTLSACQNYGQLSYEMKLPKSLKENSGIEILSENGLVWIIEDSGNKDHLYGVDSQGKIQQDIKIKNAKNVDWEDLTKDDQGNLYIGDFGNNVNKRRDLTIYKVPNPESASKKTLKAEKITFNFPEQQEFPAKKDDFLFDVEAFIHFEGNLYLFTRNRMSKKHFDGRSLLYKMPATPGNHHASLIGEIITCSETKSCQITSAALSPDQTTLVLLGYDRLWVYRDFPKMLESQKSPETILLGHHSQKEAVCFKNDSTLLISDEGDPHGGRNLYSFQLKN